jgi:hypothetical protein
MGTARASADDALSAFQSDKAYFINEARSTGAHGSKFGCSELRPLAGAFRHLGARLSHGADVSKYRSTNSYSDFTYDYQPAIFEAYDLGHKLFARVPGIDSEAKPGAANTCHNAAVAMVNRLRSIVDHYAEAKDFLRYGAPAPAPRTASLGKPRPLATASIKPR